MANINDFKIVNTYSRKMFEYIGIKKVDSLKESEKTRLGFYHLILENITGLRDIGDIKDIIIDTDYNKIVNGEIINDLGIDAVHITDDEIQLFNFKFREKFNEDKTKSENDLSVSMKFLQYIQNNQRLCDLDDKVRFRIEKIRELLDSNYIYNIKLYMVSNEAKGYANNSNVYINTLEENYGMKVVNISLDDIMGFFNVKKENQNCKFMISGDDFLCYEKDKKSSRKSYIVRLSLFDLIRITLSDQELRDNYSIENDYSIDKKKLDYSLLYDNVRGYLGETEYNVKIEQTLKSKHKEFFMFNNGITVTAKNISCDSKNSGMKYLFEIESFQIVNGGQTLRSIYEFFKNEKDDLKFIKLREASILVRIFKIEDDSELKNEIAEYTNSQNSISPADLKSVDSIQIQIEEYFKANGILYVRKAGMIGDDDYTYENRISKERLAQILYSVNGYPDRASNQKKKLFQEYYDEIFRGENFTLENAIRYSNLYFEIEKIYKDKKEHIEYYDQKTFYIIYMFEKYGCDINESIDILEDALNKHQSSVSNSRKLIQKKFKDYLDSIVEPK
ncbi:TPA: AIPR family protein [Clostridioides difficile]|nr:AIPR family protein [Clostridioides difficile]HBF8812513.1 AIPR family protein [Clostridioides difficile]HBF9056174.1 AIPR family protein [Clostridioides difficile]HBF9676676.1 AIPR family protein [Clostridioides difficile]HBF9761752.1 AIPR family protein [Clostridioides difficile]